MHSDVCSVKKKDLLLPMTGIKHILIACRSEIHVNEAPYIEYESDYILLYVLLYIYCLKGL